jgi:hypothetical protein
MALVPGTLRASQGSLFHRPRQHADDQRSHRAQLEQGADCM